MFATPRVRPLLFALAFALTLSSAIARADGPPLLFRPLLEDPDEPLVHLRVQAVTQDLRFGSDVTDSTTRGGWEEDVDGMTFDVAGGHVFRAPVWTGVAGRSGPWKRYQFTASGLVRSSFDRIRARFVVVTDYRFGGALEVQWSGEGDAGRGVTSFRTPVLTTRTGLSHRSAHVGDEVIGQARFGRNQTGLEGELSAHPPVKRTALSYETIEQIASLEFALGGAPTLRLVAGGEWKVGISGRQPWRFRSPAALAGVEWRSAGDRESVAPDPVSRALNRMLGSERLATSWYAGAEVRLARPFNFAGADNPNGDEEVWTPSLWTPNLYGREFRNYAATWYGRVGVTIHAPDARDASRGGRKAGPETVLALEWAHGYSDHGPFLDQRRRTHPRWYVVPGVTLHF